MSPMPASYLWLIQLLPFAGFLINGTLGRKMPRGLVSAVALLSTAVPAGLVAWLWAGGLLIGVGGLLALVPGSRRRPTDPASASSDLVTGAAPEQPRASGAPSIGIVASIWSMR